MGVPGVLRNIGHGSKSEGGGSRGAPPVAGGLGAAPPTRFRLRLGPKIGNFGSQKLVSGVKNMIFWNSNSEFSFELCKNIEFES